MNFKEKSLLFSNKTVCEYIVSLHQKSPLLGATLAAILERGRLFVFGGDLQADLSKVHGPLVTTQTELLGPEIFNWSSDDFYFVHTKSVDDLIVLSRSTSAQIVLVSDSPDAAPYLFDYQLLPTEFGPFCEQLRDSIIDIQKLLPGFQTTFAARPALFLDRDGVIVRHVDHLANPDQVELTPGISQLIRTARASGYLVIVVTNQSGIGRQYFTRDDYDLVNKEMLRKLAGEGASVDEIFFSPYFENAKEIYGCIKKKRRKPRPGMLLEARRTYRAELSNSILIGDRATDLIAGALAGLKSAFLYSPTGESGELSNYETWSRTLGKKLPINIVQIKSFEEIVL